MSTLPAEEVHVDIAIMLFLEAHLEVALHPFGWHIIECLNLLGVHVNVQEVNLITVLDLDGTCSDLPADSISQKWLIQHLLHQRHYAIKASLLTWDASKK